MTLKELGLPYSEEEINKIKNQLVERSMISAEELNDAIKALYPSTRECEKEHAVESLKSRVG